MHKTSARNQIGPKATCTESGVFLCPALQFRLNSTDFETLTTKHKQSLAAKALLGLQAVHLQPPDMHSQPQRNNAWLKVERQNLQAQNTSSVHIRPIFHLTEDCARELD